MGRFEYLVEARDPCEADAYTIDGIAVSDFTTPNSYDPNVTPDARYSFTGAVSHPRQIVPGGYLIWVDPGNREMETAPKRGLYAPYGERDRYSQASDTIARSMIAAAHSGRPSSPAEGLAHERVATPSAAASRSAC